MSMRFVSIAGVCLAVLTIDAFEMWTVKDGKFAIHKD
jgi:hypothetical protein